MQDERGLKKGRLDAATASATPRHFPQYTEGGGGRDMIPLVLLLAKAAKRLGVTQSALSHAIRILEEQVGVRLLARTTRSVAPTEAGEQLLDELRPALTGIRGALDRIGGLRDTPRGRVRLLVPRLAAMSVLGPKLAEFARNYPHVVLDVSTDEARLDLVASGFDAGAQYGEFIQHDMVAIRVSPDHRPAIVGAPAYFADHPKPSSPHDLLQHRCVNYRRGSGDIYRWELDKGDQSVVVAVNGPLITNDIGLLTRPALDGVGLAFMSEEQAVRPPKARAIKPRSLGPGGRLIAASMENSGDQDVFVVPIVDDIALDNDGANTLAELGPLATHARLFDEKFESLEDRVNEPDRRSSGSHPRQRKTISRRGLPRREGTADSASTTSWRAPHDRET
jgi:DNA-binding transcriptional LysR family regulator